MRLSNTQVRVPDPLVLYHHDRGRWSGSGETILNIFDFAGDMYIDPSYRDLLSRALQLNGFLVFLDPTNSNYMGQAQVLDRFLGLLKLYRDIPEKQAIDMPVAVCITKIDMLVNHYMGEGRAREWVKRLRETAAWPMSLRTIRYRSARFAEVIGEIFPGGDLIRKLHEDLGGRVMFFPLSPISIEDAEMGIDDLTQRTLNPFGVLEPVFWLLHMNGYCVLD
jgi:hypothetical protein